MVGILFFLFGFLWVPYLSLCNISTVLLILGFLFLNLVCGYALDYPCTFSYVGVLTVEHPIDLWYLLSRCW
jgi:hypothetical protein